MPLETIVDRDSGEQYFSSTNPQAVRKRLRELQDEYPDRLFGIQSSEKASMQDVWLHNGVDPMRVLCFDNYKPGMKLPYAA